jgi:pimeloyl-ACP methyl ester carboxylesterase
MHGRAKIVALALVLACAVPGPAAAQTPASPPAAEDPHAAGRAVIADLERIVTPNGVQVLETVRLGGMEQWVSIRGSDRNNPVLLFIHGGPGSNEMAFAWTFQRGWEDYFTVVHWDQRGAGKTLRQNGAEATAPTLSRERIAADAVELIAHLRERFGQDKIVVVGHSWGGPIGLDAALARPEWVSAYVGIGPLLNLKAGEEIAFERMTRMARERNDAEGMAELAALAPYPGEGPLTLERLDQERKWVMRYGGLAAGRDNATHYFRSARLSPSYDADDRAAINAGGALSVPALLDDMNTIDFLPIHQTSFPVVMFVGRHDLTTPYEVTQTWMDALDAPFKRLVMFENSAHLPMVEEPGRTLVALVEHVLPLAREGQ